MINSILFIISITISNMNHLSSISYVLFTYTQYFGLECHTIFTFTLLVVDSYYSPNATHLGACDLFPVRCSLHRVSFIGPASK